jgi:hypothetical protein
MSFLGEWCCRASCRLIFGEARYPAVMRVLLLLWALILVPAGVASAVDDNDSGTDAGTDTGSESSGSTRQPLMLVPAGCEAPELPEVVFVGTVVQRDFRTVRWEIRQVRAGDPLAFGAGQQVDVRFGLDGQFLTVGEDYLVSTVRDPFIGVLTSKIAPTPEVFGGADVVGLVNEQTDCPPVVEVARTFHTDGSEISTTVFSTMTAERTQLFAALVLPLAVMMVVLFALALIKVTLWQMLRGPRSRGSATR